MILMASELLFAPYAPKSMAPDQCIGAKFDRLLEAFELKKTVEDRRVVIKMHLGGGNGFSTIHPFFVRKLVKALKAAGAASVFITDMKRDVATAIDRGYTEEVCGCPIVPVCGEDESAFVTFPVEPPFKTMDRIELSKPILDADVLLDFSHVKGHGVCGFGGASKNLSMGAVTNAMRQLLHAQEGGLEWDDARCTRCNKCVNNCPDKAMTFKDGKLKIFFHNCKYCRHCMLICPKSAIRIERGQYVDFQQAMAMTTAKLISHFTDRQLYINVLTDVTLFCDCWGMTTPALVPDIGVLAGRDIVAIEKASLDLIADAPFYKEALPPNWKCDPDESKHIFERLHGKNPYAVVSALEKMGMGTQEYTLHEIN